MVPWREIQALFRLSPAFRRVFWSDIFAQLAQNMLAVTLPMLLLEITGDVTLTGLAFTAEIVAYGLLSPFAGWFADRCEQKALMLISNSSRFALLLSLPIATRFPHAALFYMLVSFGLGAAATLFTPARAAILRRLLDGEALLQATALEGTTMFLARLAAPALIGLVLLACHGNVGVALLLNAGLYALSNLWLCGRSVVGRPLQLPDPADASSPWHELTQGWRTMLGTPQLRGFVALDAVTTLVGMACWSTLVAFLDTVLHLPAAYNAYLQATMGLAGALGTRLQSRIPAAWRQPHVLLLGLTGSYVLVAQADSLADLMLAWTARGLVIGLMVVTISQNLARHVPDHLAGRVQAAWEQNCCLAAAAGSAATPWLLRHLGAQRSFSLFLQLVGALTLVVWAWRLRPGRQSHAA